MNNKVQFSSRLCQVMITRGKFCFIFVFFVSLLCSQINCITESEETEYYDLIEEVFKPVTINNRPTIAPTTTTEVYEKIHYGKCKVNDEKCVHQLLCVNGSVNFDGTSTFDDHVGIEDDSNSEVGNKTVCGPFKVCCKVPSHESSEFTTSPKCNKIANSMCGLRNMKWKGLRNPPTGKAHYAEFPWMVAVLSNESEGDFDLLTFRGGGSLIHPQVVLTSAHAVKNLAREKLIIRAGEWNLQAQVEICPQKEQKVKEVISHENFTSRNLQNNLALLLLEGKFPMTEFINTICLPPKDFNFAGQDCVMSGWGINEYGKHGSYSTTLKKIKLPVVERLVCQILLKQTRLGKQFRLHKSFICTGGAEKNPCIGDGGSPLVCPIPSQPDHYYLAGVYSSGIKCGGYSVPSLFASVSYNRDWIGNQLNTLLVKIYRESFPN